PTIPASWSRRSRISRPGQRWRPRFEAWTSQKVDEILLAKAWLLAYHLHANGLRFHLLLANDWPASRHYWEDLMDRRTVLKGLAGAGGLALSGGLSAPVIAQGASARTLRFVPQANLASF